MSWKIEKSIQKNTEDTESEEENDEESDEEMINISRKIRRIIKELNIPVTGVSNENRKIEELLRTLRYKKCSKYKEKSPVRIIRIILDEYVINKNIEENSKEVSFVLNKVKESRNNTMIRFKQLIIKENDIITSRKEVEEFIKSIKYIRIIQEKSEIVSEVIENFTLLKDLR
ncbi:hypothetical protein RCL_jg25480.t1 [Rhizophagus clarus]|uniref:Uncharacterized protein n=1 Tax=Rhizophagus clarus TaxID=94130 RepID=A0A8H3LE57_9GLOM|nr:hypothetical protein RCL_jg25480.t1 [Rhizophagus clarus]